MGKSITYFVRETTPSEGIHEVGFDILRLCDIKMVLPCKHLLFVFEVDVYLGKNLVENLYLGLISGCGKFPLWVGYGSFFEQCI